MKVTIVCEHNPSMDGEEGKSAYPEGMGNCIAGFMKKAGYEVTLVTYDDKGIDGLTDEILENTEVMFWWGHWYHGAVPDALADRIVYRAQRGMGMVFLHSAHVSKPFKKLTGGTGSLKWREDAEHERLWCVAPAHPIAAGLGDLLGKATCLCDWKLAHRITGEHICPSIVELMERCEVYRQIAVSQLEELAYGKE